MIIKTQTSTYILGKSKSGQFVLMKLGIDDGKESMVKPGKKYTGSAVLITNSGLEMSGIITSPLDLPEID
jgi:hypothetical protein